MSSLGKADHYKPSRSRRNDSGELDVFEAARYFSGYNDGYALGGSASNYLMAREENQGYFRAGRTSLDLPSYKHHHHHHQYNHPKVPNHHHSHHENHQKHHRQQQIKDKKYKQPSSPGGKLAHFLNSLFTQAITSKKKPSKSTKKDDEDDGSPSSGRRRRRSSCSISHFSTSVDTKSVYSCSSFGFRSPPYNLNNPPKSFRNNNNNNNNSFSDHHHPKKKKDDDHEQITRGSKLGHWVNGEKCKVKNGGKTEDSNKKETLKKLIKEEEEEEEEEEEDDGSDESDSSSDLFELQIDYGFGLCSTGLPVYETTCMDAINRSSVNNGPIQT